MSVHLRACFVALCLALFGCTTSASSPGDGATGVSRAADTSSPSIVTDKSFYLRGEPIVVTFANLPASSLYLALSFHSTQVLHGFSGTLTFANAPSLGTFEANAFDASEHTTAASASFEVVPCLGGVVTCIDYGAYSTTDSFRVTFDGMPGTANDRVVIAPAGSALSSVTTSASTNGVVTGVHTFGPIAVGSYVVRTFSGSTLLAESRVFRILSGTVLLTDKTSYTTTDPIVVSFNGLPGNEYDWVALAPVGSSLDTYVSYGYVFGATHDAITLGPLSAGTYVARAFLNNTSALFLEGTPFTVGAGSTTGVSLASSSAAYGATDSVTITFSGLPGNPYDWIAIAPSGAPVGTYATYKYTAGAISGTYDFGQLAAGTYVARAFANNTSTLLGESAPFTVGTVASGGGGPPALSSSAASYAATEHVVVTFSGLPGNAMDWIAIAPAGAPAGTYVSYAYLYGAASGTHDFGALASGTYVARAFSNNTTSLIVESASFTVGTVSSGGGSPTLTTDSASYAATAHVHVTFGGLPGNPYDWVAIAPAGSALSTYYGYAYVYGATSGTLDLGSFVAGTYVARAFSNNSSTLLVESAPFTILPASAGPTIATDSASYAAGAHVSVTFGGLPGNTYDWIAIAPAGAPVGSYVTYQYLFGATSGTRDLGAIAAGTYVARAFSNNSSTLLVESASFVVH